MTSVIKKQLPEHCVVKNAPAAHFLHISRFLSIYDALQLKATCTFFAFDFWTSAPLILSCEAGQKGLETTLQSRHVRQMKISGFTMCCPNNFYKQGLNPYPFDNESLVEIAKLQLIQLRLSGFTVHIDERACVEIGKMTTLEELHLSNLGVGTRFNDKTLEHFSNLKNLRILKLEKTGAISDAGLRHLQNMRHLRVLKIETHGVVSAECVKFLKDLPLEDLTIHSLSWEASEKIRKGIPTLKKFNGKDVSVVQIKPVPQPAFTPFHNFSFASWRAHFDDEDSLPEHYIVTQVPTVCFQHVSSFLSVYDALQLKATCKFFTFDFFIKAPLILSYKANYKALTTLLKSRHVQQLHIKGLRMICPQHSPHQPGGFDYHSIELLEALDLTYLSLSGPFVDLMPEENVIKIGRLETLEVLELSNMGIGSGLTDERLEHFSDLYELRVLKLTNELNLISDGGMYHLRKMRHLRVLEIETSIPLTGKCVEVLKKLPLEELTLISHSRDRLKTEELSKIMSTIPTLKKFTGERAEIVKELPSVPVSTATNASVPSDPQLTEIVVPPRVQETPATAVIEPSSPVNVSIVEEAPATTVIELSPPADASIVEEAPVEPASEPNASSGIFWSCIEALLGCFARFTQWLRSLFE